MKLNMLVSAIMCCFVSIHLLLLLLLSWPIESASDTSKQASEWKGEREREKGRERVEMPEEFGLVLQAKQWASSGGARTTTKPSVKHKTERLRHINYFLILHVIMHFLPSCVRMPCIRLFFLLIYHFPLATYNSAEKCVNKGNMKY